VLDGWNRALKVKLAVPTAQLRRVLLKIRPASIALFQLSWSLTLLHNFYHSHLPNSGAAKLVA
jgi:hypothetical protein